MLPVTLEDLPINFFKYRSLATPESLGFARDILLNNRLYWPSPLDFNDPYDCSPVHIMGGSKLRHELRSKKIIRRNMPNSTKAERRAAYDRAIWREPRRVEQVMEGANRNFMARSAVCSLSELGDSVLMWSHYADSHRGVCFRFKLVMDEQLMHFEFALPVVYSTQRPIIDILSDEKEHLLENALLTKADFWAYEKEWRMLDQWGKPGLRSFPPQCLDAVILGARISPEHRDEVLRWVAQRPWATKVMQSSFDDRLFRLNVTEQS
jgi:hypothetical protein